MSPLIVSVDAASSMFAQAAGTVALLNVFVFSFCADVSTVAYTFAVKDPAVNVLPFLVGVSVSDVPELTQIVTSTISPAAIKFVPVVIEPAEFARDTAEFVAYTR